MRNRVPVATTRNVSPRMGSDKGPADLFLGTEVEAKDTCVEYDPGATPEHQTRESTLPRRKETERRTKVHSLTGRMTFEMAMEAFLAVKRNRGAAGIDRVSIDMFEANLDQNLQKLLRHLKQRGRYQPKPLRRVYIPKGGGAVRPLGIPAVRDRVAQEMLRRLLEPIWEPTFHQHSYGFRPGRGCHDACEKVREIFKQGYRVVLDADIKGFFDNIPHELIMDLLASRVADGNILSIVRKLLTSGVMEDGVYRNTSKGTPQGGVISPLLANIVLDVLDHKLAKAGYQQLRYADDFLVLCKTHKEAERAYAVVRSIIEDELGLELSKEKTKIASFAEGFEFLGFRFNSWKTTMRHKSVEKFKDKIRQETIRSHNLDQDTIERMNRVIRGTANYFATTWSNVNRLFCDLDRWIRMRLRCMKRKRKSMRDNLRLRNRWFRQRGMVFLSDLLPVRQTGVLAPPKGAM